MYMYYFSIAYDHVHTDTHIQTHHHHDALYTQKIHDISLSMKCYQTFTHWIEPCAFRLFVRTFCLHLMIYDFLHWMSQKLLKTIVRSIDRSLTSRWFVTICDAYVCIVCMRLQYFCKDQPCTLLTCEYKENKKKRKTGCTKRIEARHGIQFTKSHSLYSGWQFDAVLIRNGHNIYMWQTKHTFYNIEMSWFFWDFVCDNGIWPLNGVYACLLMWRRKSDT